MKNVKTRFIKITYHNTKNNSKLLSYELFPGEIFGLVAPST
jgi:hypothetical protein